LELNQVFDPSLERVRREPYTFRSGAIYIGEWKGNFRDGYGKMTWPNGTEYKGNWSRNRASGIGDLNNYVEKYYGDFC